MFQGSIYKIKIIERKKGASEKVPKLEKKTVVT